MSIKNNQSFGWKCPCFIAEHRSEDRMWRHRNGQIAAEYCSPSKGVEKFESHYPDGQIHTTGLLKHDHPVGVWHTFGLGKHYVYTYDNNGKLVSSKCLSLPTKREKQLERAA